MSILELILLFLAGIILIISAVFASIAANQITKIPKSTSNKHLIDAHSWLTWGSVLSWLGIALIIAIIILYIFYNSKSGDKNKALEFSSDGVIRFSLFLVIGLLIVGGIFSAIAANEIDKSGSTGVQEQNARSSAVIAAVLALVGGGIAVFILLISFYKTWRYNGKKKEKKKEKEKVE